ncbi:MAG TPA: phosphate signaling complex protein PhoU [Candidatus Enterenecus stercoripullorum]|nr:phosphate signaling complex protein PhoU [Candidatus Enterenecus stercoripullorum]
MRKTFDAELLELGHELTAMADTAQDAIDLVTASLSKGGEEGAKAAIELTSSMDQMERDIENHCMSLLMRQQPVARDLRTISTALKMVTDLQRIGDQAANIAEISLLMASDGEKPEVPEDLAIMSRQAGLMVRQAIAAYADRDETTALAVVNLDDVVDELFVKLKHDLTDKIAHQEDHTGRAVDLIIIAKYLERIADHAVNIANWAIFCVTGQLQ